jgi:NAD(P)-dependent dehydrogenase (short-subunit alcohol dehydrogenase family)
MADDAKIALVTGSALNIGRAIALALAEDGFRIMTTASPSWPGHKGHDDFEQTLLPRLLILPLILMPTDTPGHHELAPPVCQWLRRLA